MNLLAFLGGLLQIALIFLTNWAQKEQEKKDKNKEIINLTKQAFTGDIKDAASKMSSAIDRLGDIK